MKHYLVEFANGKTVISYDNSYTTMITWEEMYQSEIILVTEILN